MDTQYKAINNFSITIIFTLCIYTYAFNFLSSLPQKYYWDYASLFMAVGICIPTFYLFKTNPFSSAFYGVTIQGWRLALTEGVIYTLPILPLIVLGKWLLIQFVPSFHHKPLFSGFFSHSFMVFQQQHQYTLVILLAMMCLYLIFTPLQEFIARGLLQSSLQHFLIGKYNTLFAILISNLIFSTLHLYLSLGYALSALIPGIFWGWLYARHKTLLGVTVSHMMVGIWAIYFVGLRGLLV